MRYRPSLRRLCRRRRPPRPLSQRGSKRCGVLPSISNSQRTGRRRKLHPADGGPAQPVAMGYWTGYRSGFAVRRPNRGRRHHRPRQRHRLHSCRRPLTAIRSSARKAAPPKRHHDSQAQQTLWTGRTASTSIANSRPTTAPPTRNHQTSAPGGLSELRAHPILRGHRGPARRRRPRKAERSGRTEARRAGFPQRRLAVATGDDAVRLPETRRSAGQTDHHPSDLAAACIGALRGTMTVTLEGNECSQRGATIEIPAVAAHVSEVPPGVELPSSLSDTFRPPAPTAHPR